MIKKCPDRDLKFNQKLAQKLIQKATHISPQSVHITAPWLLPNSPPDRHAKFPNQLTFLLPKLALKFVSNPPQNCN
ncbi:hypothetical protein L596_021334 [Steinernema carpocapsae]|uniref:Uncharacterized protein n=1 Tax=Steinernema carpocapsae TaxID=34508 RepID=A0A4U5MJ98_STECR|nr:hypothetical protein L596_021334 [Steinernema carpocapsae]